jgi:PAS domain S-box-containing protein
MKNNEFKPDIIQQSEFATDNHTEAHNLTPAAHFILSPAGRILSLNPYGLVLLDNARTEIIGHEFCSFIAEKQQSTFNTFLQKLLLNNDALTCELTLQTNNYTTKHIIISGIPINSNEISLTITDRTKRISEEAAVRKSEELLTKITENAPDIIVKLDRAGTILYINRIPLGFKKGKVIGTNYKAWNSRDDYLKMTSALNRVFEEGVTVTFKTSAYDTNNKIHWFRSSLSPLIEDDGVKNAILIARDITEIKIAEETLKESKEKYHAIMLAAMDGFWLLDLEGNILEVNEAYCKMSGYTESELLSMRIVDIDDCDNVTEIAERANRIKQKGEERFESRHRRKDGSILHVELNVQYSKIDGGHLLVFIHDITKYKEVEENLIASEDRYKSLFHNNLSVILLINPASGEIKDANMAACNYYGWSHSELCTKNISDINTLPKAEITAAIKKANNEMLTHFYFKHRLASGEIRDVEIYSAIVKFPDSSLLYSIVHDITDRKQAEERIIESESLLRESQEVAHIGSYSCDLRSKIWKATPELLNIFGVDETYPNTLDSWIESVHPDFKKKLIDDLFYKDIEKKIYQHQYKIIRINDKVERWVQGTGFFEFDNNNKRIKLIGTIQDITKRKVAELALTNLNLELENKVALRTKELSASNKALQLAEEKYRTVADFTFGWEFWIDTNDRIVYCSPSCERITGYKSSEFINDPMLLLNIVHPEDLKIFIRHKYMEAKAKEANHGVQYRIITKYGDTKWISHECCPIYNANGEFIGNRGSNKDITRRKKTEQLLRMSNQKYKLLSENITDGIFIYRNGEFEYINKAVSNILGYEKKELDGLNFTHYILPEYHSQLEEILTNVTPYNQSRNIEVECYKKDNTIITIEILSNYISSQKAIYGIVHDITERKQIQKKILNAIIQTEEREKSNFSKELHDGLGPLLSTIKLYLQWSERPNNNVPREEIIHKAQDILEEAIATVKEVSNKLSPHLLTYYGLSAAIKSFTDKLNETSSIIINFESNFDKRLKIEIEAALYRAIIECINNTLKYANAKNINIKIINSDEQFVIQYSDDGIGFNIEETISQHKGLGLFNLQNRIQTVGGKIMLTSKKNEGVYYQFIINND